MKTDLKVFRALYSNSTIGPFTTISSSCRIIRLAASSVARTSSFEKSADPSQQNSEYRKKKGFWCEEAEALV